MARPRDDSKGLSLQSYADSRKARGLRGGSLAGVRLAVKTGRIKRNRHGRIDPGEADAAWASNTTTSASPRGDARRRLEEAKAATAELRLQRERGELVRADLIAAEAFGRALAHRNRMLGIPARVAGLLVGLEDVSEVERRLMASIEEALTAEADEA